MFKVKGMSVWAVITFVPSLMLNVLLSIFTARKWYDRVDENVVLGALPFARLVDKLVKEENIKAVVSMNEDYELWFCYGKNEWDRAGISFLQLPVADMFDTPQQETLERGVNFILQFLKEVQGDKPTVYVHCKAGRTRSATLAACYLMQRYGWDSDRAVQHLVEKRPQVWLFRAQREAVRNYYRSIRTRQ